MGFSIAFAIRSVDRSVDPIQSGQDAPPTVRSVEGSSIAMGALLGFLAAEVREHVDEGGVVSDGGGAEEADAVTLGGIAGFVVEVV